MRPQVMKTVPIESSASNVCSTGWGKLHVHGIRPSTVPSCELATNTSNLSLVSIVASRMASFHSLHSTWMTPQPPLCQGTPLRLRGSFWVSSRCGIWGSWETSWVLGLHTIERIVRSHSLRMCTSRPSLLTQEWPSPNPTSYPWHQVHSLIATLGHLSNSPMLVSSVLLFMPPSALTSTPHLLSSNCLSFPQIQVLPTLQC